MQDLIEELIFALKTDRKYVRDDVLLKNTIIEHALKPDKDLLKLLLATKRLKAQFFTDVSGTLVFDQQRFIRFVSSKAFLPDSYTAFKNKIGLMTADDYLIDTGNVVLAWPYKDCVLEGGMEEENEKRDEVFFNETLAPDEVDRLREPKVLAKFLRVHAGGEEAVSDVTGNENLFIRGNNLLALFSLRKKYEGRVKIIYIDPPYNLDADTFYNDSFNHSTWLTFMRNRLECARDLLHKSGVIFVQIDYHELPYLNVMMNEIFGRSNLVQLISVKTATPAGFKTVNPGPIDVTEYILFYARSKADCPFKRSYVPVGYDSNYNQVVVNKQEPPENWRLAPLREVVFSQGGSEFAEAKDVTAKEAKKKFGRHWQAVLASLMAEYALKHADRVVSIRDPHKPTDKLRAFLAHSKEEPGKVFVYKKEQDEANGEDAGYIVNGGVLAFYSNKVRDVDGERTPTELLTDFWDDISWAGIAKEGGVRLKNGKKPEKLIKRVIELVAPEPDDIIMDFFSGSGTTAAVAHKMGKRYIAAEQLDYGDNDTAARLRNVIGGDQSGVSKAVGWKGGGSFICCELMKYNQVYVDKVTEARTSEELLAIWNIMKEKAYLGYRVDVHKFDERAEDFARLSLADQKRFLIEVLDKNHLYVNLADIDDNDYAVSDEDKQLNRLFYA